MDVNIINKLIEGRIRTPDNILGKELMFIMFPEIKSRLIYSGPNKKMISMKELEKYGIIKINSNNLIFYEEDFPELFEENK